MSICIGCGICCDGTMFSHVGFEGAESNDAFAHAGVTVLIDIKKKPYFSQPCVAFEDDCCKIYADRPGTCRKFRCRLLDATEAGDVAERDARRLIEQVKELSDSLRPQLEVVTKSLKPQPLGHLYRTLGELIQNSPDRVKAQRDHADLLFKVVALRRILAESFESAKTSERLTPGWSDEDISSAE